MERFAVKEKISEWVGKYKYLLLILLVGIALMLIPKSDEKPSETEPATHSVTQEKTMAQQLEEILQNIHGAGRVQVMLTTQEGEQIIYQTDTPASDRADTVIITDGNRGQSGLVQQVIPPTYRGAIILCQGAERASVCLAITEAVSKVTGLDASKISVLKMK